MAALQTLRDKAAVFITIIISLALLAFILTDFLGTGNTLFSDRETVGEVNGEKIKIQDYQVKIDRAEAFAKMNSQTGTLSDDEQSQVREQVWNKEIHDITFGALYEKAGIDVTPDELLDMAMGQHIAPALNQLFRNPQTGVYDRQAVENFLRNKGNDPQASFFWQNVEQSLKDNRLMQKYMTLLRQSVFCTDSQLGVEKARRAETADAAVVAVRYSAIPDSSLEVSKSDIKARYERNKEMYRCPEARDIDYVTFPIKPTPADREEAMKQMELLKKDFEDPETDAFNYAQMNSEAPVQERFLNAAQLSPALAKFVETATVGQVYGPYAEGDMFKLSRLAAVSMRPDSVRARHILIRDDEKLADSLLTVVKAGANFADVARQYSQDPGSAVNGGDLDWFADGAMVPEFNEACFTNPPGTITLVKSQFGYHIINVQNRKAEVKKYDIATIEKQLQYSSRTQQNVYADALQFSTQLKNADMLSALADSSNLVKRTARSVRPAAQGVNNIRHARDLVRWAFEEGTEVGDISELFLCDDEFVLAVLTKKQERGYLPLADAGGAIADELRNEMKATQIAQATSGKSLSEVAAQYSSKVDTAHAVTFASSNVPGVGNEPALVGAILKAQAGQPFPVVKGNNAAYLGQVVSREALPAASDEDIKSAYQQQALGAFYGLQQYVTNVDIDDQRIKFY